MAQVIAVMASLPASQFPLLSQSFAIVKNDKKKKKQKSKKVIPFQSLWTKRGPRIPILPEKKAQSQRLVPAEHLKGT